MSNTAMTTSAAAAAAAAAAGAITASAAPQAQHLRITPRRSADRGFADHGWLHTHHTFSFASYWHPAHQSYGPLRVINEDRVARSTGFGSHSHAEFLIFSYLVRGELEHRDSLGHVETLRRGDVQFTSAGTGVRHSEWNRNASVDNHFLQIWAKPNVSGLAPQYVTRSFPDALKLDRLCRIMESTSRLPDGDDDSKAGPHDAIPLHADLTMDAAILAPGKRVVHKVVQASAESKGARKLYAHLIMSAKETPKTGGAKIKIGNEILAEGDGAFIDGATDTLAIESVGDVPAEFILFDMGDA